MLWLCSLSILCYDCPQGWVTLQDTNRDHPLEHASSSHMLVILGSDLAGTVGGFSGAELCPVCSDAMQHAGIHLS